jgi:tyrosine-protein kinase Etk/Wzc
VSKLLDDMQEAAKERVERPLANAAMSQLFDLVDQGGPLIQQPARGRLEACRKLELPKLARPVLLPQHETDSTHAAFEAFRSLRTKLMRFQSTQGVRSVVVSSANMKEGKTLSTLNLGLCLSQLDNASVLMIDADVRSAGLSSLLGFSGELGLADVLSGKASFESVLVTTNIPGLHFVGAGEPQAPASNLFIGSRWRDFVGWCNETFTLVIVDAPPILGLADFDVISAGCDGVLIVVRAQKTRRDLFAKLKDDLEGKKVLGILLNGKELRSGNKYSCGKDRYYYSRARRK